MNAWNLHQRSCQNTRRYHLWQQVALICAILFMVGGCATCRKQIKTYISGQEQDVAFPLRQVMLAAGKGLTDLNLNLSRIELVGSGGLIQAHGPDREATLRFKQMDRDNTRLHIDIFTGEKARDISSEEALSRHIDELIAGKGLPSLEEMTAKMIPVYKTPATDSPIIAYLAGGTVVSITSDQKGWSNMALLSGGAGYVSSRNIRSVPNDTAVNIPKV